MNSSISQNKNQINQIFSENNSFQEPNIRKAQFVVSSNRIYTLEFDQNIEMQELKIMIQKAAHLKKNSFNLFNGGEDYTQYTDETFDSLFPDQTLVIFTLELRLGEVNEDEAELLLQINMPCPEHNYKFLLYYCFDCEKSICSECFTNGSHRGHKIQDKCFYLLPSKYLVEKMFDNWSKKPYEDFQISVDLNEYKNKLNNVVFKRLFEMLKETQNKCNILIDKYNIINQNSLSNIRNSVRNIKLSCIKGLDEYKDVINIKDIINNQEIFLDFDHTYKEMGKKQKEKFRENLQKFQELNKEISILVQNLINNVCNNINDALTKCLDNRRYEDIERKIISDKKMKIKRKKQRRTMNNTYNKFIQNINESVKREINKDNNQGRNTMMPDNLSSINNLESIYNNSNNNDNNFGYNSNNRNNNFLSFNDANENINNNNPIDSSFQRQDNKNNINDNYTGNNMSKLLYDRNFDNRNDIKDFNNNHSFNPFNIDSNNNQEQLANKNKENESLNNYIETDNKNDLFKNNSNNNSNKNSFNNSSNNNSFSNNHQINLNNEQNGHLFNTNTKVQPSPNIFDNILNKNNFKDNHNYLNSISNKRLNNTLNMDSIDQISPILDNRATQTNNGNISVNSSINNDINSIYNINNSTQANKEKGILNNNNGNNNDNVKNPLSNENIINYKNNNNQINFDSNSKPQNITLESPFSNINATISSNVNENNKNINNYDNNPNFDNKTNNILENNNNKYLAGLANNCKIILEEANESESDLKSRKEQKINIEYYLNKEFILCPIPSTKKLKIITAIESDENTISLNFPNNFGFSSFLCDSSYCNHNRKIYISGGVDSKFFIKKFFMIDLSNINKKNDSYIYELSPMIYSRCNHSMIAQGNEIYAVGGDDSNTVEKYNIRENKWTELSCMLKKRSNPMLVIDNGYLYAFFGSGKFGHYPESIERLNLENNSSIWEMILFSNPSNIDTRCYGCGIHKVDELIYFFGGKCNEETSNGIFFFNLLERRIDYTNSKLKWKESFKENKLFELGNKMVQISDEKYFGIYLKIMTK